MNNFVGRQQELNILNDIYLNRNAFVLVTGMRHSGTTGLIREFSKDKPVFYFSSRQIADEFNREHFLQALSEYFSAKNIKKDPLPSWEQIFKAYVDKEESGRKILVIDNLDYLIQSNSDLIKILPEVWNKYLKPKNILLIGIISNSSILTSLEEERNVLMSTVDVQLNLQPITFIDMLRYFPEKKYAEAVSLYALVGGIPKYWDFFKDTNNISQQLTRAKEHMLKPSGWFYEMPLHLLEKDVWDPICYSSLLVALAAGNDTFEKLVKATGYREKNVKKYLNNLVSLKYIKGEVPITHKKYRLKNARFSFVNPAMRFWYKYVYPNQSFLEFGKEDQVLKKIMNDYPLFIQQTFENISKEMFLAATQQSSLNFNVDKIGSYWKKDIEIPIVAIDNQNKQILFADADFSTKSYTINQFDDFIEKTMNLPDFKRYKDYKRVYGLFVVTKPDQALINYANQTDDVVLFNNTAIYKKS